MITAPPVHLLVWLAATLLAGPALAQLTDDDQNKLLAASRRENSYVLETLLKSLPLGPSIDALLADHQLRDESRETRTQQLANWTADRLPSLWYAEPDRRVARAPVFARLTDFLVDRLAQCRADAPEREQILQVVLHGPWQAHRIGEILAMEPREDQRRAAAEMQRALVRSELACGGSRFDPTGFVTATKTASADRRERAEAVQQLRNRFRPCVLPWLELERAIDPCNPAWPSNQEWPPTPRQLAQWWIQAGLRVPVEAPPQYSSTLLHSPSGDDRRATACFAQAVVATADARLSLLGIIVSSTDKRVALRALGGLMARSMGGMYFPVIEDSRIAPLTTALLDHDEPYIASFAARQARCLVERGLDTPELRQALVSRALAILSAPGNALTMAPAYSGGCCTPSGEQAGEPASAAADVVMAAALTGDPRIVPLIAARPRQDLGSRDADRMQCVFWQKCLAAVAPWLDAETARRVVSELEPRLRTWAATNPPHRELQALLDVELAARLLPAVPEDLLQIYVEVFGRSEHLQVPFLDLLDLPANAPAGRLRQFVGLMQLRGDPRLHLLVPEVLFAALRDGGDRTARAVDLLRAGSHYRFAIAKRPRIRKRLVDAFAAAPVPREVAPFVLACVANMLQFTPSELLANLPAGGWHDEPWAALVTGCLQLAPPGTLESDLEALRTFGRGPSPAIAEAAARRLAGLGESGREDLGATLDCLVRCGGQFTDAALSLAVQAGIDTPALRAALPPEGRQSLPGDAFAIRFLGMDPRRVSCGDPVQAILDAPIDTDVPTLRDALGTRAVDLLRNILQHGTPVTRASALRLACELDRWPLSLQEHVIAATVDHAPRIRLAAYTALKSRNPELHLCAWLVNEVVFDPDPAVRALGR